MKARGLTPGKRSRHCMSVDPESSDVLMFGGVDWGGSGKLLNETWVFQNNRWALVDSAPQPRHRGAMVFDELQGAHVLFGGQNRFNSMCRDTWMHDGDGWFRVRKPYFSKWPSARCGHAMAFDRTVGRTILFGGVVGWGRSVGDTWTFDGAHWEKLGISGPCARRYSAFAYSPRLKGCVLHGGSEDDEGKFGLGDTWLFRDGRWTDLGMNFETESRDDHSIAVCGETSACYLFAGVGDSEEVLRFSATGWAETAYIPSADAWQCSPVVWHPASGHFLSFGGEKYQTGPQSAETHFDSVDR